MPILNDIQYECDLCHEIFSLRKDEIWNQKKADEEYQKLFPDSSSKGRRVVCDDCWQLIKPE